MTEVSREAIHGGDAWIGTHWHCYATEGQWDKEIHPEGEWVSHHSPQGVLTWFQGKLSNLGTERDKLWWGIQEGLLSWGKSIGSIAYSGPGMTMRLDAVAKKDCCNEPQ